MSASSCPKHIQIKRVQVNDFGQLPSDLSSTPGGTLFSTTPGAEPSAVKVQLKPCMSALAILSYQQTVLRSKLVMTLKLQGCVEGFSSCLKELSSDSSPECTRIVYDRAFLMQCRNSPLAKSPPNLPKIPGVTCPVEDSAKGGKKQKDSKVMHKEKPALSAGRSSDEPQFDMDL